jgi:hypothetical protein
MKTSNQSVSKTMYIGLIASENLSSDQDAHIFGKTSKGIFFKTSGRWLVFLSFDQFRGPLTITLEEVNPILHHAAIGNPIHVTSKSLFFPDSDITITIQGSKVWQTRPTSTPLVNGLECHEKLVCFTKEVMSKKNGVGLGKLLPFLLGLPKTHPTPRIIRGFDWADIQQLQYYIKSGEADMLAWLLSQVLGSGPGLTPSADDFTMGLLLTLNSWPNSNWTAGALRDLNLQVVKAAYAKTTSLSANLIECATLGLADERLINALDWLATGAAQEPEIVDHLLGWGNSSGVDAFTGMAVALTAYQFYNQED